MVKLGIFASLLTLCAALSYATIESTPAEAAAACKRTEFKTKLVKEACAKGGQKAAKDDMKAWLKATKTKNPKIEGCPTCHSKVGGDYPLKPDALKLFAENGGELLEEPAKTPPAAPPPAAPPAKTPPPATTK
jgi:hypothetical protein